MEQPFFFENNGYSIFGILHSPEGRNSGYGFVFCYPFAFEGETCRRIYAAFARRLESIGYYVLRFNYMGTGDSCGNSEDITIETLISDVVKAISVLHEKSKVHGIGLLGMRLGATLAGLAAIESNIKVDSLILWDPIMDIRKYFDNGLRQSITFQNVIFREIFFDRKQIIEKLLSDGKIEHQGYQLNVIDGSIISRDLYIQSANIDPLTRIGNYSGNILIVQIDKNTAPFRSELIELENLCTRNGNKVALLHVEESMSWWTPEAKNWVSEPDRLFGVTENWICEVTKNNG